MFKIVCAIAVCLMGSPIYAQTKTQIFKAAETVAVKSIAISRASINLNQMRSSLRAGSEERDYANTAEVEGSSAGDKLSDFEFLAAILEGITLASDEVVVKVQIQKFAKIAISSLDAHVQILNVILTHIKSGALLAEVTKIRDDMIASQDAFRTIGVNKDST